MSIITSVKFNGDQLQAALPAGASFVTAGADPTIAAPKTVTFYGTDDATGQAAVTAASAQFVDRTGNQTTLQQKAQTALAANATFLAINSPTNAQVLTQVQALTKECSALIRLLLSQLDSVAGT